MLLANLVIPHHHHESEVCIVVSHCESDGENHTHDSSDHNHNHDTSKDTDYCALNQVYIVTTDNIKPDYSLVILLSNSYNAVDVQLPETDMETVNSTSIGFQQLYQSNLFLYNKFVSSCKGLRAPPIV